MDVRMRAGESIPAVLAGTAWPRLRPRAEEPLPQPERQPLLSDARRAVQQQRARKRVATNGVVESRAEDRVAMKRE
jgi:hypothetical protein